MTTTHTDEAEPLDDLEDVEQPDDVDDTDDATGNSPPNSRGSGAEPRARRGIRPRIPGGGRSPVRGNRLIALLLAAALALTGLGAWFTIETNQLRSSEAATNTALVDSAATAEVTAAVTNALNQIFSYSFDTVERTKQAAERVLRGEALASYVRLFGQVSELAPEQRITVTARVAKSAVTHLGDGRARMLVFLNQTATREGQDSPSSAAAQLSITAERADGQWIITELVPQ